EICASCLQPVYSMERVVTDKVCVHHSCFCCQVCGRKLSLQNYAALHGVFYCQVHYK
ncbi:LIMD2 protein, partial [Chunga burmeisteri]|nr:LIMD2 protein [Chunga burmeisteri]